jgi:hypothetical protein
VEASSGEVLKNEVGKKLQVGMRKEGVGTGRKRVRRDKPEGKERAPESFRSP